jgi:O-methyltransferase involved in polyketide biosynthesis
MSGEQVDLRGAPATLLLTLYLRALDAQSRSPILGDRWADEVLKQIDYDFGRFKHARGDAATVACRAKMLDAWTSEFLAEHPDGQVLHLGCGLDSRPLRVAIPGAARWIDLDYPDVIDLGRRLYRLPHQVETVAMSVTDPRWTQMASSERITLVLAEGVLPYLTGSDVHELVERATKSVARGILAFDVIAGWAVAASRHTRAYREMGAELRWAYRTQSLSLATRACDD